MAVRRLWKVAAAVLWAARLLAFTVYMNFWYDYKRNAPSTAHSSDARMHREYMRGVTVYLTDTEKARLGREAGCVLVTDNERGFQRIRRLVPFESMKPWPGGQDC